MWSARALYGLAVGFSVKDVCFGEENKEEGKLAMSGGSLSGGSSLASVSSGPPSSSRTRTRAFVEKLLGPDGKNALAFWKSISSQWARVGDVWLEGKSRMQWNSERPHPGGQQRIESQHRAGKITEEQMRDALEMDVEKTWLYGKYLELWVLVGTEGQREFGKYNEVEELKARNPVQDTR